MSKKQKNISNNDSKVFTKSDVISEILIWKNYNKRENTQNRTVAEQINENVIIIANKTKWQGKIRESIEFFEGKRPDLIAYFQEQEEQGKDPIENICVIYLFLALFHDNLLKMNYIITEELQKLNPDLFSWTNYNAYCVEDRVHLFWEHVKQDLEPNVVSPKQIFECSSNMSKQMSKEDMKAALGFRPTQDRKFNTFAKSQGIVRIGVQSWRIPLDGLNEKERERLDKV
jgi:hypothetical protein